MDYLKLNQEASDFNYRGKLFVELHPTEKYKGTAAQNIRLLNTLILKRKVLTIPLPSDQIVGCKAFYEHPEISKFLADAFAKNVVKACVVTGSKEPEAKIRLELQKIYRLRKPVNGKVFTADEHKAIHDEAYASAG